jgi:hypothetical protein
MERLEPPGVQAPGEPPTYRQKIAFCRKHENYLKLFGNIQEGEQMNKFLLVKLVVLFIVTATLSGCYWGPRGFGHHHSGGHDNGHHSRGGHDRD